MMKRDIFKAVNRTFRDILDCDNILFRGIMVYFSGDFRQTLLVIPRANIAEVISSCLKNSRLW